MDKATFDTLVGDLIGDPNHDRWTTTQIGVEADNTQDRWNVHAKILKDVSVITTVAGTRRYTISGFTSSITIAFLRVTHRGLELNRRDKTYFDLFAGDDWTDDEGTPTDYMIDYTDPDNQYLVVYPTPRAEDEGDNLSVEFIKRHTPMSADSDEPFNSNTMIRPYHWGIAYETASRLLARDVSPVAPQNAAKATVYQRIAENVLAEVVQTFKAQEREEPFRLRPARFAPRH